MSLLREIQTDLSTKEPDLPTVLRKCKILAARLGSREFARWVDLELNGYPDGEPIPSYRRVHSVCYANFIGFGWSQANRQSVPWGLIKQNIREQLHHREIATGIAGIADFAEGGARVDLPQLVPQMQGTMYPDMNCVGVWMETSGSEFTQLLSAVGNRVLDFVLKIEEENPEAGEAALNTHPVPAERIQSIVQQVFNAPVANVSQNSHNFTQTGHVGVSTAELKTLVKELTKHLDELHLKPADKKAAEVQIATIEAQLVDKPDPEVIKQVGRTLRNVAEGAVASLIATGATNPAVWHMIQSILAKF
jgi:phospholipase/lecithinase/hemolysin